MESTMLPENEGYYSFAEKWSPDVEQYNFTQVPNLLLGCQGHLLLSDGELLTLIHLMTFWFNTDSQIYPSIETLTKFSHKGYSTIQARLKRLEKKGFIKRRQRRGTSNTYDLSLCVNKLAQHQAVCSRPPRKQGEHLAKTRAVLPWFLMTKEDESLTRPNLRNTLQVGGFDNENPG